MSLILGDSDKNIYVKDVDKDNAKIELTTKREDAKTYIDSWWAQTELDWLKFYCTEQEEELKNMRWIET